MADSVCVAIPIEWLSIGNIGEFGDKLMKRILRPGKAYVRQENAESAARY
jgi:hypothetical protein